MPFRHKSSFLLHAVKQLSIEKIIRNIEDATICTDRSWYFSKEILIRQMFTVCKHGNDGLYFMRNF